MSDQPALLTREVLDKMGCPCGAPACHGSPVYFHARCHSRVPTWVSYEHGVLRTECFECGATVVRIEVPSVAAVTAAADDLQMACEALCKQLVVLFDPNDCGDCRTDEACATHAVISDVLAAIAKARGEASNE